MIDKWLLIVIALVYVLTQPAVMLYAIWVDRLRDNP